MPPVDLPFVSVIIPTHNRPERLPQCLAALTRLEYPSARWEVIVVDDGSPRPLDEVVRPFEKMLNLTLLRQPQQGPAAARNSGAHHARGELLGFTDDDCEPDPGWLHAFAGAHGAAPGALLGGQTRNALEDNLFATASQMLVSYLYRYYDPQRGDGFFASNNLAVPAARFLDMGGFDRSFPIAAGEDRYFCDQWQKRDYSMKLVENAIVHHAHALTLRRFWRQHFNYGRGAFQFHRLRARHGQERMTPEPLHFYWDLVRYPFSETGIGRAVVLSTLMVLSQVANAVGYFWEAARQRRRSG